jgi:hypothetical protein
MPLSRMNILPAGVGASAPRQDVGGNPAYAQRPVPTTRARGDGKKARHTLRVARRAMRHAAMPGRRARALHTRTDAKGQMQKMVFL